LSGAGFHRGASKQDYATPKEFIEAVEKRYGKLVFDLAAHTDNHVTPAWFGPGGLAEDSLAVNWYDACPAGNLWLNPPFDNIAPWAEKCALDRRQDQRILFLVPASVGSNWFANHVYGHAQVVFVRPRLSFDGKNPYPKDCMLCAYGDLYPGEPECICWDWRNQL